MPNLMENKLILQYLSGAGAAIGGEGSFAAGLDQITQQNIATQNYMKMVQQQQSGAKKRNQDQMKLIRELLGGGAKVSMDKDTVSIKAPSKLLGGEEGMSSLVTGGGAVTEQEPVALNPSASPSDISSADLAGLTPQNISQALQLGMTSEELGRKSISDIMDMVYKKEVLASKDYRTPMQKNYEYAQTQGFEGSIVEFKNATETTHMKDFKAAVKSGYKGKFHDWLLEMTKAGGINLGEIRAKGEIGADIKIESEFISPKFVSGIEKSIEKESRHIYENVPGEGAEYEVNRKNAKNRLIAEKIEARLNGSGAVENWDADLVDGVIVWTVKFISGKTTKIRLKK